MSMSEEQLQALQDRTERARGLREEGLSYRAIAVRMGICEETVRKYIEGVTTQDVVMFLDGGRLTVSHGLGAERARETALFLSRRRSVASHTVEAI